MTRPTTPSEMADHAEIVELESQVERAARALAEENHDRLLNNFKGTARTVMWMADPTRWTDG